MSNNSEKYIDGSLKQQRSEGTVDLRTVSSSANDSEVEGNFGDINHRKFLWKLDVHIIPWLCVLYLLSFLDRSAIGNAKLYGLEEEIGASDLQYRLGLTIFFIPYALFEPVTNVMLKLFRPSIFLSAVVLAWGTCLTLTGVIQNPAGLYATRFFLGLTEAALFPGATFFLSCWYKKQELGLRSAIFFAAASASGAFGGLLSVAIAQMGGTAGYSSWRWIFIILGLISVACAFLSFWLVADFPHQAKFLTPREREYAIKRLQADDQYTAAGEHFEWKYVKQALTDVKTYLFAFVYVGADMPLYSISLAMPTIVKNLGFETTTQANLITVPVYIWACIVTVAQGFAADRTGYRSYYHLGFAGLGGAGYIILIASRNFSLSYAALYLVAMGIYPLISNTVTWVNNNIEGQHKRAVVSGIVIGFGNINGAVSSNVYRAEDSPWFRLGAGMVLMYTGIGYIACILAILHIKRENRQRDAGLRQEIISDCTDVKQNIFTSDGEAKMMLGDHHSSFRYRL